MKQFMYKSFFLFLVVCSLAVAINASAAEVYKTVDKDGNVTYTDKPPAGGAKPMDLPPLSVIETPVYEKPAKAEESEEDKEMSLGYLRQQYSDFAIVAPPQEESVWHPEVAMSMAWNTRYQLQEGMQVTVYVDGKQVARTADQIIPVPDLDRGEHKLEAQLTDSKNRRIATAEPVTFFIRRPNLYNRARSGPGR